MSEHLDVVSGDRRAPSPSVGSTPITTHYAPRRRHCSESKRRYPAVMRFAVCSEAFAAALIWVGVSRIFLHIRWRTVLGSPYPFTQYKAPARCAT